MSHPSTIAHTPAVTIPELTARIAATVFAWGKRHATVYHMVVISTLGLATVGFTALIAVLLLIETNFNILEWIE